MKYVDEYRSGSEVRAVIAAIERITTRPWTIMEICGGQTHAIVKYGIDQLLPEKITLVHGPGCPVCVTPVEMIDHAIHIASQEDTVLATFGDMSRVPGSSIDLLTAKARGADVRMVYSPLDAIRLAEEHPQKDIVFFAVGFETTAPATALALQQAMTKDLSNFTALVAHVRVPPAIAAILADADCRIEGFLAAGHVCTIMGMDEYTPLVERFRIPMVVTGFEPLDIVQGVYHVIRQLEQGQYKLDNKYARAVSATGNTIARDLLNVVFVPVDRQWRGIDSIAKSGLELSAAYQRFDAARRFPFAGLPDNEQPAGDSSCISGKILIGQARPEDCKAFGKRCTPDHPLGAPMVSSEGACAAYFRHRSHSPIKTPNTKITEDQTVDTTRTTKTSL